MDKKELILIKNLENITKEFDDVLSKFRNKIFEYKIENSPDPKLSREIYSLFGKRSKLHINFISRNLNINKKNLSPSLDYLEKVGLIEGREDYMTDGGGKIYSI